jgi:tetratricopeptide (TPR) repeat protein
MTPKKDETFERYKKLAEASIRESLALDNDYQGHILLAELLKDDPNRLDEAEDHLNQARSLTTNRDAELTIENSLGEIAMKREQYHKALRHFQRVAEIEPINAEAWYNIAEAHNLLDSVDEAEANYIRAIAIEPEIIDYYTAYSRMHMEHGQTSKALEILEEGLRVNPGSAQLRAFLALAVSESGDYRKAEELLDEAERLDPDLDMVEMYRLLINVNKTTKLPAVKKTKQLPGKKKINQLPGFKDVKNRAREK